MHDREYGNRAFRCDEGHAAPNAVPTDAEPRFDRLGGKVFVAAVIDVLKTDWEPLLGAAELPDPVVETIAERIVCLLIGNAAEDELVAYLEATGGVVGERAVSREAILNLTRRLFAFREAARLVLRRHGSGSAGADPE